MHHRVITNKEKKEIEKIKEWGKYKHQTGCWKTRIEYLSLAFLKYLIYTGIITWNQGITNQFRGINDKLSKGERSKAVSFLIKKGAIYREGTRLVCLERKKLINIMEEMERNLL